MAYAFLGVTSFKGFHFPFSSHDDTTTLHMTQNEFMSGTKTKLAAGVYGGTCFFKLLLTLLLATAVPI